MITKQEKEKVVTLVRQINVPPCLLIFESFSTISPRPMLLLTPHVYLLFQTFFYISYIEIGDSNANIPISNFL